MLLFCRAHLKQSLLRLTLYDWRSPTSPCWGKFSTASSSRSSTSSRAFEGSWELLAAFSGTRPTWPQGLPGSTGTTWASPWQGAPSLGEQGACRVRSNFESKTIFLHHIKRTLHCVTIAPLSYFIRSWVALSFKVVSQSVSEWGIGNTCPDLHFVQYIKAWVSSTDPVSSITNCYRLIVSYNDPVHSFIIS